MSVIIASGGAVLRRDRAGRVFFAGVGGSEDGDRPFLELRSLFPRSLAAPPPALPLPGAAGGAKGPATAVGATEGAAGGATEARVQDALPHGVVEEHTASLRLWRCQVPMRPMSVSEGDEAIQIYEAIHNVRCMYI